MRLQFAAGAGSRALDHPKASGRKMNSVPPAGEDEAARTRAVGAGRVASSSLHPGYGPCYWRYSPKYLSAIWIPSSYIFWYSG
jgi:hypothetical protein